MVEFLNQISNRFDKNTSERVSNIIENLKDKYNDNSLYSLDYKYNKLPYQVHYIVLNLYPLLFLILICLYLQLSTF